MSLSSFFKDLSYKKTLKSLRSDFRMDEEHLKALGSKGSYGFKSGEAVDYLAVILKDHRFVELLIAYQEEFKARNLDYGSFLTWRLYTLSPLLNSRDILEISQFISSNATKFVEAAKGTTWNQKGIIWESGFNQMFKKCDSNDALHVFRNLDKGGFLSEMVPKNYEECCSEMFMEIISHVGREQGLPMIRTSKLFKSVSKTDSFINAVAYKAQPLAIIL